MLRGALPRCHLHHSHAEAEPLLHCQSHRPLLPYLHDCLLGILPPCRKWGKGQLGDNHSAGFGRLSAHGGRKYATYT